METSIKNKISWETRDGIGFLVFIDEPENRMDSLFFEELNFLTENVISQSNASAIIIHGKGRHFSSGANLEELTEKMKDQSNGVQMLSDNYSSFQFFEELNIPVIAVIRGVCIGSALELALHSHFRLCSEDALFGLPESTFGLMPGAGGILKMSEFAGKAKAIELAIRGNIFNAEDAFNWRIVDLVFSKIEVMEKAMTLARFTSTEYRKYNKKEYLNSLLKKENIQ